MHARAGEPLDAFAVGERLQKADEHLPFVEARHLVGARGRHLGDHVGVPRRCDRGAHVAVGGVVERSLLAGIRLDDHLDPVAEPPNGLGDESHAPLALDPLPGNADAHARATLSNRPEIGAVLAECGRSTPRR